MEAAEIMKRHPVIDFLSLFLLIGSVGWLAFGPDKWAEQWPEVNGAMAAAGKTTVRNIDLKRLQKHLVDMKILKPKVLADKDSFPLPEEQIAAAVQSLNESYQGIPVLMSSIDVALPMLRDGYGKAASDQAKLRFAHVLGMLGDGMGAEALIAAIGAAEWDKGWNFRGMGQFGP